MTCAYAREHNDTMLLFCPVAREEKYAEADISLLMRPGDPFDRHMSRRCVAFSAMEDDLGLSEVTSRYTIGDGATPTTVTSSLQTRGEEECKARKKPLA